ncbi:MAG: succinate dehydrogenase, cytochrome b556 subunit [Pseudomonadota bacterium]
MADVNRGNRPLSPHLTIYRPQLTSITSILTRITGNALLVAGLLIVWWFLAAATSPEYFAIVDGLLTSWLGDLILTLSVWALWYHFFAGLRHLYWDTGRGFELDHAYLLGYGVIAGSIILTILTLIIV